jgi:tetratricopeptide (TPR) repeat protein
LIGMNANDSFAQAQAHYRAGELDRAKAIAADILKKEPGHSGALQLVEDIAFAAGDFADAIAWFSAAIAINPADSALQYKLGCLLEAHGDLQGALGAYSAALRLNPSFAKGQNNLGATLQMLGRNEKALQCFHRALELDPSLWQAHYNIGNLHKLNGRLADAMQPFQSAMRLRRAPGEAAPPDSAALFAATTRSKLAHDIEQLNYLMDRGILSRDNAPAVAALETAARVLAPQFAASSAVAFPAKMHGAAAPLYNRLVHFYDAPALPGPAVNPKLDRDQIEAAYAASGPGIISVDDFLTPEALASLRRFCVESTIWFDYLYDGGYVGASLEEGFACALLAQIAVELPRALPRIFGDHPLTHLWGYKYDSQRSGIGEHADFAAVNVNFWLTPDEANLDPDSGGLVVWDKEAPSDWDFDAFNRDVERIRQFLRASGARPVTIPHRQNRVVIFNSDLFHKTDDYRFRPGYLNRRLNVTFLYGYRQTSEDPTGGVNAA